MRLAQGSSWTCGLFESHFSSHSPFSTFFSTFFSTLFPAPAPNPMSTPSLPTSPNHCATPQGGLFFGRVAEQSPLTGYEPKTLIEVNSEHTPINLHSRKSSLDTDVNDLATTLDVSEMIDTTDVVVDSTAVFSGMRRKC